MIIEARNSIIKCASLQAIMLGGIVAPFIPGAEDRATLYAFIYEYEIEYILYILSFCMIFVWIFFAKQLILAAKMVSVIKIDDELLRISNSRDDYSVMLSDIAGIEKLKYEIYRISLKNGGVKDFSVLLLRNLKDFESELKLLRSKGIAVTGA